MTEVEVGAAGPRLRLIRVGRMSDKMVRLGAARGAGIVQITDIFSGLKRLLWVG